MKKVIFYPNPAKTHISAFAIKVLKQLAARGVQVAVPEKASQLLQNAREAVYLPDDQVFDNGELLIVLGGDGTILHVAEAAAVRKLPIFGINAGRLGFLTEIEPQELHLLDKALKKDYTLDTRMMLSVSVVRGGQIVYRRNALNEAIVTKQQIARTIGVKIFADRRPLIRYDGDGVILCTPTGSTAYSMSAGGPIVEPAAANIIVTPICAHVLNPRSFVVRPGCLLEVQLRLRQAKGAYLSADGRDAFLLSEKDTVLVNRSELETRLVRVTDRSFSEIIDQKFSRIRVNN